jgi:hypothetical protein
MEKPKIRQVEAFPVEQDGQTYICLRDPTGIAPAPIMIGMGAYFLVTLFNGSYGNPISWPHLRNASANRCRRNISTD